MIAQSTLNSLETFSGSPSQENRARAGLAIAMDGSLNADKVRRIGNKLTEIQLGIGGVGSWKMFIETRLGN